MSKDKGKYLTPSQLTFTLISSMIGVGVLTLPLDVIKYAKQDGWISCIIGSVYPLYFVFLAQYLHKKFPEENILLVSNKCFGKFFGYIFNFVFMLFFLLSITHIAAGISNVLMVYMTPFLSRNKIVIAGLLVPAFIAYKGIKTIGRINEIIFYLTLILFFIPLAGLKEGHLFNVTPIFGSGVINIIKSAKDTALAYSGIEILTLIYPFIKENNKIKQCGIASIIITGIVYTWFTFITIFYLGIDIVPKFLWPVVTISEAITIPIINSFRYIFMGLYSISMFRTLSTYYYGFTFGLSQLIKCVNRKSLVILSFPLLFYLSTKYGSPVTRRAFVGKAVALSAMYNIIYISMIALIISMKKDKKCEEKDGQ